jgi:hypothetical protein
MPKAINLAVPLHLTIRPLGYIMMHLFTRHIMNTFGGQLKIHFITAHFEAPQGGVKVLG